MSTKTKVRRVYSYVRFSTPPQSRGYSEERQVEAGAEWIKREGHVLDTSLDLTDRGLSGFHGKHRTKGKLGKFMSAVESGNIERGSILLVENIDRLGREGPITTLKEIIFKLWEAGITLQTISPEETYDKASSESPKFVVLILYLQRAWDESKRKSDLIVKSWNKARTKAREEKAFFTSRLPTWLKLEWKMVNGEKKISKVSVIPEAKATIQSIFDMRLEGMGWGAIEAKLNAKATWTPPYNPKRNGKGWRKSFIQKICDSVATIGVYQPYKQTANGRTEAGDAIEDYFPAVVDRDLFNAVKKLRKSERNKGGNRGKGKNLFSTLCRCGYCGGSVIYLKNGAGRSRLVCDAGRRGAGCKRNAISYTEVERLILRNCHDIKPEEVLPNQSEQVAKVAGLRKRIAGKEGELEGIDTQIDNLIEHLANAKDADILKRVEDKVGKLKERRALTEAGLSADRVELEKAEQSQKSFKEWQSNLKTMMAKLESGDLELRLKLRAHLRSFLSKIEVYGDGHPETMVKITRQTPKALVPVIRELNAKKVTREGRFLYLWYSTKKRTMALAPLDSVALLNAERYVEEKKLRERQAQPA
jgi:DNA invertase Pin-like site-specific DNA recombinase